MAVPANTQQTYDLAGNLREDLSSVVYKLEPSDTPLLSRSKKVKAKNTNYEWLTDSLRSARDNAQIEGDDLTGTARPKRPRLGNYVQIFGDVVPLSDTAQQGKTAEGRKQMAIEIAKELKAQKLDVERAFFQNQAKVAGDGATVPSRLAGLPSWIKTNTIAGVGGADPAGDGSNTRTDGTAAPFVEADLKSVLQSIWNEGGKAKTVYLNPDLLGAAAGFTGNAPRREMKNSGKVSAVIDVYVTNFGEVQFVPHRHIRDTDVVITDADTVRVAEYRPFKQEPLGKTGLNDKVMVSAQLTLVVGNEKNLGLIADRSAA